MRTKWKGMAVCVVCVTVAGTLLLGCGAVKQNPKQDIVQDVPQETRQAALIEEIPEATEAPITLEMLLGEDYVQFLTETITMQMGNRMEKNPDVRYYPITDKAPLSNYVILGEETQFEVDADSTLVIVFPAGSVTDKDNGVQRFRIQRIATE